MLLYFILLIVVLVFFNFFNLKGFLKFLQIDFSSRPKKFETNLLALTSFVIKADGAINKVQLKYVRDYFIRTYGKEKANISFRDFKFLTKQGVSISELCLRISGSMPYPAKLKLIVFLYVVAKSDGFVTSSEELKIREIAAYMSISQSDYRQIQVRYFKFQKTNTQSNYSSVYSQTDSSSYDRLGVSQDTSIVGIKKAYRTLVKKYHPDRLQDNSIEAKILAKEKFQLIQSAYEKIKLEKGF